MQLVGILVVKLVWDPMAARGEGFCIVNTVDACSALLALVVRGVYYSQHWDSSSVIDAI